MSTMAELVSSIEQLVAAVDKRREALDVSAPVKISRGGAETVFELTTAGSLVCADNNQPVKLTELDHADLSTIVHELIMYLNYTQQ